MLNKKILITISAGFLVAILTTTSFAKAADLNQAVSTLPQNDEWSIMAYAALGQNVGQSFLSQPINDDTATDYEKRILAITAQGSDPATVSSENFVAKLESMFDGTQLGSPSLLNDDIFGILALKSAGTGDNIVSASRQFILNNQNSDGGWGFGPGVGSDSNTTAMAVAALAITGTVPANALTYLQQSQDSSGGYGFSPGQAADGASTAWVISGLISAGQSVPDNAKNYLENLQLADGSFKWHPTDTAGSSLVTAYAVIALSGHGLPIRAISQPQPPPQPTPVPQPQPVPIPEPASTPTPEPQPTPAPQPEPSPMPVPAPEPSPNPAPQPQPIATQPTNSYPEDCLVPVFVTNFAFPPEGGQIVTIGSQMYFVKTYEPGCSNPTPGTVVPVTNPNPVSPTPVNQPIVTQPTNSYPDDCLVPVFNTTFAFPPEGGQIVTIGSQMYFVKTYEAGCNNAGSQGSPVPVTNPVMMNNPPPVASPFPISNPQPAPLALPTPPQATQSITMSVRYNSANIFQGQVPYASQTVLSALQQAAAQSGFNVVVNQTSLGSFVSAIGGYGPSGASGWQYAVDGTVPTTGAANYTLHSGDSVQWFYGAPGANPF